MDGSRCLVNMYRRLCEEQKRGFWVSQGRPPGRCKDRAEVWIMTWCEMSVGEGMDTLSGDAGRNWGRKWGKALSYRGFWEAEHGWNEAYLFTYLFFKHLVFIGGIVINSVVIVSGGQRRDSAIHINVSILSQTLLPSRLPHNIEQSSLCYTGGPCSLSILNIAVCMCPSQTPCLFPLSFP